MRNLFLILLLANVVYFGWQYTHTPAGEPGVTVVDPGRASPQTSLPQPGGEDAAPDNGPADSATNTEGSLPDEGDGGAVSADADEAAGEAGDPDADGPAEGAKSAEPPPRDAAAVADEAPVVLASAERPASAATAAGTACISIGPFPDADAAQTALAVAESRGMTVSQRSYQDDVFAGHWVQVTNIPTREQANTLIGKLKEGGLADAYLLRSEPGNNAISLGLFSDINGAERISQRAEETGVETVTQETYRERTVYWVDAGRARAADASTLAERFGADNVIVGDAASCPEGG